MTKATPSSDHSTAMTARKAWNGGMVGPTPLERLTTPSPFKRECTVDVCGSTEGAAPATGMVFVHVKGSREPGRWYCAGPCAGYGQAYADVRSLPETIHGPRKPTRTSPASSR
ncbi:hypothetical protein ABZ883_04665 [Streptomyces sp. NPDC046977]|uniref:hypothetical protein n=1 Tax=Streptomyces sp. NPDC046977 TaxID=3154703 RepID=UPI0033E2F5F0